MRLNTPSYWYKDRSITAAALAPASFLYYAGHKIHQLCAKAYKTDSPVICIGNLVAGGSGKTPAALALLETIRNEFHEKVPCFLTRGYGGKEKGPLHVDTQKHDFRDVGDEALILARYAPTVICANRKQGAEYIEHRDFDLIIMDDGLQNPALHKDLKFVVIDGQSGFGNRMLLPAGPLREPVKSGIRKADAFILIGDDVKNVRALIPDDKPVFSARLEIPDSWIADTNIPYIAFCGIGRPEKFRYTLADKGLNIVGWHSFPDHYNYTQKDMEQLAAEAESKSARLITTQKDAVRLPAGFAQTNHLDILPVRLAWDNTEQLSTFLKEKL